VNPVFNINFHRVEKRGRKQEYEKKKEEKKEDGGQNKRQKVTGM
jgi:hypothetical protein